MFSKTKGLVAAGLIAAAVAVNAPAAGAAVAVCSGTPGVTDGSNVTFVLTGKFVATGPYDVQLSCYVKQGGATVFAVTDGGVGPVAAIETPVTVANYPYTICYSAYVEHLVNGSSYTQTNC